MVTKNHLVRGIFYGLVLITALWNVSARAQLVEDKEPNIRTILGLVYTGKTPVDRLVSKEKVLSAATTLIVVNDYLTERRKTNPSVEPLFCRPRGPLTIEENTRLLNDALKLFDDLDRSDAAFEYGLLIAFMKHYQCR